MLDNFYIGKGINSYLMRENHMPILYPDVNNKLKYRKSRLEILSDRHFQMIKDSCGYRIWAEKFHDENYCLPKDAIITDINQNKITISGEKPIVIAVVKNMKKIKCSELSEYISSTMLTRNYTLTLCIRLKNLKNSRFSDTIRLSFAIPSNGEGRTPGENIISYIKSYLNRNIIVYNKILNMESTYKTYSGISRVNEFNHPDLDSDNVTVVMTGKEFHEMCTTILRRTTQYTISKYLLNNYFNKNNRWWTEDNSVVSIYLYLSRYFNGKLTLDSINDTKLRKKYTDDLALFTNEFRIFSSYVVDEISEARNTRSYLMARIICAMNEFSRGNIDTMISLKNTINAVVEIGNQNPRY